MSATQDEVNKQRAALLTAIATQGSAGKTAYEAEQARQAEYAKAAAASLSSVSGGPGTAPPAAFLAQLRAEAAAQQGVYAQDNKMAQTNYNNSIAQTAMSNAAYMDQARAAVPVVEAQTAGQIAQIRAQQEEARLQREEAAKERAYNERMRALGLQERAQGDAQQSNEDAQAYLQEAQQDARRKVLAKADLEGMGQDLGAIVAASSDLGDAMRNALMMSRKANLDPTKIRAFQRWVYRYYTGSEPSTDPQNFGYQVRKYGGNPDHVPGYLNSSER